MQPFIQDSSYTGHFSYMAGTSTTKTLFLTAALLGRALPEIEIKLLVLSPPSETSSMLPLPLVIFFIVVLYSSIITCFSPQSKRILFSDNRSGSARH